MGVAPATLNIPAATMPVIAAKPTAVAAAGGGGGHGLRTVPQQIQIQTSAVSTSGQTTSLTTKQVRFTR